MRRQLLVLAFQRGCSQADIVQQTGFPVGTVKSHVRRALALMKTLIGGADADADADADAVRPSPQA